MFQRKLKVGYIVLAWLNIYATAYYGNYIFFLMKQEFGFGNRENLLMAAILERRPELELVIATTGEEALCMAAGLHPALLLLDLGLPDCHGSRLLGLLRALPGCETVPAVAVTADVMSSWPVTTMTSTLGMLPFTFSRS